jgi:type II secretory pathway predicted ATPase ExeA
MDEEALLSIKAMVNFNQNSQSCICFILSGQPELRNTISFHHFESLKQRIKLNVHLTGMNLQDTCAYIDHSLNVFGRESPIFSDSAKIEIFNRSEGITRKVNNLCYQTMLNGAISKWDIIESRNLPFPD